MYGLTYGSHTYAGKTSGALVAASIGLFILRSVYGLARTLSDRSKSTVLFRNSACVLKSNPTSATLYEKGREKTIDLN